MSSALLFLLSRSWKNRVLSRFRRLRSPKYLVSALAGLAYLYFVILHQPFISHRPEIPQNDVTPDPGAFLTVETLLACMVMVVVVCQWFFSKTRMPLFNEAEVQILFSAPLSRGSLLNYLIAKAQIGVIFGSLVSLLIFERTRLAPHAIFLLITIWAVYSFLYLYRVGVLLAKQSLERQRTRGRRRETWVAAIVLLTAIIVVMSAHWYYPPLPADSQLSVGSLFVWLKQVVRSGPVFYVLFPFRLLVRPAFARGPSEFLLHFAPVLLMIAAVYAWIRRSHGGFEESAMGEHGRSESAPDVSGWEKRRSVVRKPRRAPFKLKPDGFASGAIYWKNTSQGVGFSMRRALPGLAAIAVFSILLAGATRKEVPIIIGSASFGLAGFLMLLGPTIFRNDLRTDLRNIDLLKSYPISGWGVVLGEVLGPLTILTVLQLLLVFLSAGLMPGMREQAWPLSQRIYIGIGAALLLPCLSLIGILVQNAAVLLLPGWVQVGKEHQRGVEAMGQRLISGILTVLSILIAAVPAALLFIVMWVAGYWLIGLAIIPIASFMAACGLLTEAALGILWLGRLFDRFDVSKELA